MKFLEIFKNRYNVLILVIAVMLFILSFRLATLTIVEGDHYRDLSDNKRLKEISITAPRGEIRDRHGRLLAGNKPSFTVQILKDELSKNKKTRNEIILKLVRLLEEDGVDYVDDFPIELNVFEYSTDEDYSKENISPDDKVIDIIVENKLLPSVLNTFYKAGDSSETYYFITANKAIHALENKGIEVPVSTKIEGGNLSIYFDDSKDIDKWKKENDIPGNMDAKGTLLKLIGDDKNIIRNIISHPISRELTYNLIKNKGLQSNIKMEPYAIVYDMEFLEQKRFLMKKFNNITIESKARDDFTNIVLQTSIDELLRTVIEETDKKGNTINKVIPGQLLISKIEEKGTECPVIYEVNEKENTVIYKYKDGKKSDADKKPIETLIELGKETKTIGSVITDDKIKNRTQEILLNNGINPKITVSEWKYASLKNKNDWFTKYKIPKKSSPEEAFEYLRKEFEIDKDINPYETRSVLLMYDQLQKQGYRAYEPINVAYGIKDTTVAKIEEGMMEVPSVKVSIEPIRYYPMGTTAAHALGYLGKISQPNEISKYINEQKYSPNDLIGKTGVEETFEDKLRGKNGIKKVEVDVLGNTTKVLSEEKAIPGDNLYLTMDAKLQQVAEESLKKTLEGIQVAGTYESEWGNYKFGTSRKKGRPYKNATSGAVVAVDVKTGELLALANYPAYDPNLFATGISSADWESLFPENEEDLLAPRPLLNTATQTAVQPGSIYKMVTALAGLEKGMNPEKTIRDMGKVDIGDTEMGCWIWNDNKGTHGPVNVYEALRDSCNYYFYSLALGMNQKTGESLGVKLEIEDITNMSKEFGLGEKTGIEINIPNESSGGVPDPESKIVSTKGLLRRDLNQNIKKYIKEDVKMTDKEIEETIEEIVSWIDMEVPLTRGEVYNKLDEFGIDPDKILDGEREGLTDKIKYTYLGQSGWSIGNTLNVSIGQGENAYTPVQMANYIATLANGGYRHEITLVDKIKNYDNSEIVFEENKKAERMKLNNYENLDHVKKGMEKVVSEGTARSIFADFPISAAAKTGTAERSGVNPATGDTYDSYAWFVGFAPYEDPEIAVAAIVVQGGSGGYAGPMVRDIIAEYLGLNSEEETKVMPYGNELAR